MFCKNKAAANILDVKFGDNVIIGAGSVVNRDIPSNCVAVGSPCRPVKSIDEYVETVKNGGYLDTKGMSCEKKQQAWEKRLEE